ncbi:MAG: hypothetical protein ACK5IQ_06090 [Bacteroidales bacterium]
MRENRERMQRGVFMSRIKIQVLWALGVLLGETSKFADITTLRGTPKYIELKNKDFPLADNGGTLSQADIEQVINKKGALGYISNMDNYRWKAVSARKNANVGNLKKLWQKAFADNANEVFEAIWGNRSLSNDVFDAKSSLTPRQQFNELIGNTNSKLYQFIKTE